MTGRQQQRLVFVLTVVIGLAVATAQLRHHHASQKQ